MILLDSNIVIYSTRPEFNSLRKFLAGYNLSVSIVSYIEVLGFTNLIDSDKSEFEAFFSVTKIFGLTDEIATRAISLKQSKRMTLGDSVIAATALIHNVKLITVNIKDFNWIGGLIVINPIDAE